MKFFANLKKNLCNRAIVAEREIQVKSLAKLELQLAVSNNIRQEQMSEYARTQAVIHLGRIKASAVYIAQFEKQIEACKAQISRCDSALSLLPQEVLTLPHPLCNF